ncbi:MAG: hypothetical protein Q4G13_00625 [Moraxella sp.]|nr:hypothetical protein [Moraxella sp.]
MIWVSYISSTKQKIPPKKDGIFVKKVKQNHTKVQYLLEFCYSMNYNVFYQDKVQQHQVLIGYRHRPKSSGGYLGEKR